MQGARKQVLACEPDPAELHRLLTNLPVLGQLSADELCQQAASLFKQSPPSKLVSTARLRFTWWAVQLSACSHFVVKTPVTSHHAIVLRLICNIIHWLMFASEQSEHLCNHAFQVKYVCSWADYTH